eukprot:scaffold50737_cov13-Tisochrysis_lutea.AAC.1
MEQHVLEKLARAAAAVLDNLSARFPSSDLAWAMGCVYPACWQQLPDEVGQQAAGPSLGLA